MKDRKEVTERRLDEIKRYLKDEMNPSERNEFERKLQSDPFLAEAVEGYSLMDPDLINTDIKQIKRSLKGTRRQSTLIYRVAAAIIILIAVSSVLLVKNLRRPEIQMAETVLSPGDGDTALEIPDKDMLREEQVITENLKIGKQARKEMPELKKGAGITSRSPDTLKEIPAIPEAQAAMKKASGISRVTGMPVAIRDSSGRARPVTGMEKYIEYLAENHVYPVSQDKTGDAVVEMEIIIADDGSIDKIKILKSPGKAFADEARRLINEGPAWLPAIKNSETVRDTVILDILFKKQD